MPQASAELNARWDGPSDVKAMQHLEGVGFVLLRGWTWRKPNHDYVLTEDDCSAIQFLIDEWDFGSVES